MTLTELTATDLVILAVMVLCAAVVAFIRWAREKDRGE